ncbi:hypothetical protein A2699_06410 [Candidatus Gottesmanbacteria bacterium RIFCSPHIGHO2_01_FULL_43_15]|nr:MAG: hypothetical protein A2699_06410 [Candidatus Gottesmanbacteria bacterium RIFCSPHIGHO2_01_FULL_43_15]
MKYDLRVPIQSGNLLEVVQDVPEKGMRFPTVLLVPGFGMDLHESGYFDQASDILVRNGFQTFRFSFSGTGKSQGNFVDMTLTKQADELREVLKSIKTDRFTNPRKIGILAQSFGSVAAIAAQPLAGIKSYVFTSAPADPYQSLEKWFKRQRGYNPEGISEIERTDKRITRVGREFWQNLKQHDLSKQMQHIKEPIKLIYGGKDIRIKPWEFQDLYVHASGRKNLVVVEKSNHAFTGKARPVVLALIAEWFNETLR